MCAQDRSALQYAQRRLSKAIRDGSSHKVIMELRKEVVRSRQRLAERQAALMGARKQAGERNTLVVAA